MDSVQKWMTRIKLPRDLRTKIRNYYAEVGEAASASTCQQDGSSVVLTSPLDLLLISMQPS